MSDAASRFCQAAARSSISAQFFGEAGIYTGFDIPLIERIAHNAPQFTRDDTPDKVMTELLRPTTAAFVDIIKKIEVTAVDDMK